jgi:hypothetical protein
MHNTGATAGRAVLAASQTFCAIDLKVIEDLMAFVQLQSIFYNMEYV